MRLRLAERAEQQFQAIYQLTSTVAHAENIEEVFADSVGKSVRAGDPLFTIYSPDLVATEQDFLLALKSRTLLRGSSVDSAAQGSENLIAAARERLRLWDVTDQDIQNLETEGKERAPIPGKD